MDLSRTDGRSISLPIHHNCGLHWSPGLSCGTPWGLPRSVSSPLLLHGWGARVVVTLPLTAWLPSYDAHNWSEIQGSNL